MRPAWRQVVATQYLFKSYEDYRWRSSGALERFLTQAVDQAAFRDEYARWHADTTYSRAAWRRPSYAHWYLGHYVPLYVASLQRALLAVAPARDAASLRVLDIGVGVGTTALALLDLANTSAEIGLGPPIDIDLTCIDHDADKLETARRNVAAFSKHLAPEAAGLAERMGKARRWRCADVGKLPGDFLSEPPYDLVVLGNVVRELELEQVHPEPRAPDARNARRELVETLISRLLAPGGLVLLTEHAVAEAHDRVEVVCRFRCELSGVGVMPVGPCQSADPCASHDLRECKCVRGFQFEWPDYYVALAPEQDARRTVRSLWAACRRPAGDGRDCLWGEEACEPDLPALEAQSGAPVVCARCGGETSFRIAKGRQVFACDAWVQLGGTCEGSVTEADGSVVMPNDLRTSRDNKRRLVAGEVRRIVEKSESERTAECERAIADFTFVSGSVYKNGMWSYEVLELFSGGERIRVRRLDTGEEKTLLSHAAARLHLEATTGESEDPPPG